MGVVLETIVNARSSTNANKGEQVRGCDHSPFVFFRQGGAESEH
jgi:hypothetical protein